MTCDQAPAGEAVPAFAERYDPDRGLVGSLGYDEARQRDAAGDEWVAAWPDRVLAVHRSEGTMTIHSVGTSGQRGYLAYGLARKTRQWRLGYLYVQGVDGTYMLVNVPLWEGRATVAAAPFESPSELDPPPEHLRALGPPTFGEWEPVLAVTVEPQEWIAVPDGFTVVG